MSSRPEHRRLDYRRRRLTLLIGLVVLVIAALAIWHVARGLFEADRQGAEVTHIEFDSKAVGQNERVAVVVPAEHADHPPLLVFLHGRGNDEDTNLVDAMFAGLAEQGDRAPIVAFPDGGDSSYWHDRSTGDWEKYVVDEVIPRVVEETAAGTDPAGLSGPELWLDRGDSDPFVPGDDALVSALKGAGVAIDSHGWKGGHDGDYRNAHWSAYLRFYARALAGCA